MCDCLEMLLDTARRSSAEPSTTASRCQLRRLPGRLTATTSARWLHLGGTRSPRPSSTPTPRTSCRATRRHPAPALPRSAPRVTMPRTTTTSSRTRAQCRHPAASAAACCQQRRRDADEIWPPASTCRRVQSRLRWHPGKCCVCPSCVSCGVCETFCGRVGPRCGRRRATPSLLRPPSASGRVRQSIGDAVGLGGRFQTTNMLGYKASDAATMPDGPTPTCTSRSPRASRRRPCENACSTSPSSCRRPGCGSEPARPGLGCPAPRRPSSRALGPAEPLQRGGGDRHLLS